MSLNFNKFIFNGIFLQCKILLSKNLPWAITIQQNGQREYGQKGTDGDSHEEDAPLFAGIIQIAIIAQFKVFLLFPFAQCTILWKFYGIIWWNLANRQIYFENAE